MIYAFWNNKGVTGKTNLTFQSIARYAELHPEQNPMIFTFQNLSQGICEVRDFQTTGVVAFAMGKPFSRLNAGRQLISDGEVQIRADYLANCQASIDDLVSRL